MSNNYIPTTWIAGKTIGTADVMNNIENGITEAHDRLDVVNEQFNTIDNKVTVNQWINDLTGELVAHKGYNGLKYDGPITNCVVPDNTVSAIELAGEMGFKCVELDVQKCVDGFIIHHEHDTKLLSGDTSNIGDLTVSQIKSRNIIKNYKGGGSFETLEGVKANNKVPTLEEALISCKKYNMYVLFDFQYTNDYVFNDDDINNIVNIIKKVNYEKKCLIYGNGSSKITDILKDSVCCFTNIDTNNLETSVKKIKAKRNYCLHLNETKFLELRPYIQEYNIPALVWTIDDYNKIDDLFKNQTTAILTNRCLKNINIKNKHKINITLDKFRTNGVGQETVNNGVHTISSENYFSKNFIINANKLQVGDVIVVKAEGRTTQSNATGAYGRINITNDKSSYYLVTSLALFKNDTFETKSVAYVVTDETEKIYVEYGMAGGGYSGNGTCELKNISVEIYSKNPLMEKCQGFLWCYRNGFSLRNGYNHSGIKSIYRKEGDNSTLCIEHENVTLDDKIPITLCTMDGYSTQYKYRVLTQNTTSSKNIVEVKFLNNDNTYVEDVNTLELGFNILII